MQESDKNKAISKKQKPPKKKYAQPNLITEKEPRKLEEAAEAPTCGPATSMA